MFGFMVAPKDKPAGPHCSTPQTVLSLTSYVHKIPWGTQESLCPLQKNDKKGSHFSGCESHLTSSCLLFSLSLFFLFLSLLSFFHRMFNPRFIVSVVITRGEFSPMDHRAQSTTHQAPPLERGRKAAAPRRRGERQQNTTQQKLGRNENSDKHEKMKFIQNSKYMERT